jgi:hypothetical protein
MIRAEPPQNGEKKTAYLDRASRPIETADEFNGLVEGFA